MIEFSRRTLKAADEAGATLRETLSSLRKLTLDEFGEVLLNLPDNNYPHLSALLPSMAPEQIQQEWTGASGLTLLRQSVSFMNFVATTFTNIQGVPFRNVNVLDFGCGWGRLLRLLSYFNDPQYCFGCDAWQISLDHARRCGVEKLVHSLEKSDPVPSALPFELHSFDLVYAFSIFTHLSEPAAVACMREIRQVLKPAGIAIITIRPPEFWDYYESISATHREALKEEQQRGRVAFYPANGKESDSTGQLVTYGDTGIPLDRLESLFQGWKILRAGTTLVDPYQVFVVLKAMEL